MSIARAFWRMYITASGGSPNVQFATLEFRTAINGAQQAVFGSPIESSRFDSFRGSENVFDTDASTTWANSTGQFPSYVGYHFVSDVLIVEVLVKFMAGGFFDQAPKDFKIQSSPDNITWTDEWSVTNQTAWSSGESRVFTNPLIPPSTPTITVTRLNGTHIRMAGSAYAGPGVHVSSQWQLAHSEDFTFITPVHDSGATIVDKVIHDVLVDPSFSLIGRVRYTNGTGGVSDWGINFLGVDPSPPPEKPTLHIVRLSSTSLRATGSAYVGPDAHGSSQWQVTRFSDPGFGSVVHDSGVSSDLLIHDATELPVSSLIARVRYTSTFGQVGAWSDASNILDIPASTGGGNVPSPVVFPFEPDGAESITETVIYKTDIITSHQDHEQRIALRRRPTLKFKWRVTTMENGEAGRLSGLLWRTISNRWYVPLWSHARRATAIIAGTYFVDMTDHRFGFTENVLVWKNSRTWDLMTLGVISGSGISLTGATSFTHAANEVLVIPLGIGSLSQQYNLDRAAVVSTGSLEFEIDTTNTLPLTPLAPAQSYHGAEVLAIHSDTQDGFEHEQWTLSSERSGAELGPFLYRAYGITPVVVRPKSWVLTSRAERETFRRWLATRRGRKEPLWVPTYQDDFTLTTPALVNAGWIDIEAVGFADQYLSSNARVNLVAFLPDRTVVPMTINAANPLGETWERLFLEEPLPIALSVGMRLSLMVFARLTDDAVTMEHVTSDITLVSTSFTELPREIPVSSPSFPVAGAILTSTDVYEFKANRVPTGDGVVTAIREDGTPMTAVAVDSNTILLY